MNITRHFKKKYDNIANIVFTASGNLPCHLMYALFIVNGLFGFIFSISSLKIPESVTSIEQRMFKSFAKIT